MRAEFFKNLTGIPLEKQLNLTKGLFEAICASKGHFLILRKQLYVLHCLKTLQYVLDPAGIAKIYII
jgi:hypothetical protein